MPPLNLPRVIFSELSPPVFGGSEWVVLRVTAKRIYIGQKGTLRERIYDRAGRAISSYDKSRIDLVATGIEKLD